MPENLTAAIIAGGKSRRFGTAKALAPFGKKSMIEHAITLAGKIAPAVLLSVGEDNLFHDCGIPIVQDIYPDCGGPLGGIYSVLEFAQTPWVAMLPCDMPLLSASVYTLLYQHRQNGRPVVAVSQTGIEPLVSIWPKSLSKIFETTLAEKQFAIYKVIETLAPVKISVAEHLSGYRPEMFFNVNRREDLERLKPLIHT